ncbi:MAG: caspase family protein [Acidobacteria bacterium]|nr:caspase family protein [Acidobacteriota bacterium]
MERDTDVRFEAIELDDVLASTVGADLRVVILDACRNNPLARSMQRTGASRSVSRGSFGNLDEGLLGDETLVAYAAAAGTTADDGTGRNSPYTSALLSYLEQPLELGLLFREVRGRVLEATDVS